MEKKSKYDHLLENIDKDKMESWKKEQDKLKLLMTELDDISINNFNDDNFKIGGVDISASKNNPDKAIVGFCVIDLKFNIIYEDYAFITITEPYVPGFLAFREVDHLIELIEKIKDKPEVQPNVILVDGNGKLHSNKFGLACHLGVRLNIPTIGCGKTIFSVDGITSKKVKEDSKVLQKSGDFFYLKGDSGEIWGAALKSTDKNTNPIYLSIGNKITIDTAIKIVELSVRFRVPEPIRISDLTTRKILTKYENNKFVEFDIRDYLKTQNRDYLKYDKDN